MILLNSKYATAILLKHDFFGFRSLSRKNIHVDVSAAMTHFRNGSSSKIQARTGSNRRHPPVEALAAISSLSDSTSTVAVEDKDMNSKFSSTELSNSAQWHSERRKAMISKYGTKITHLEREASSQRFALPLLLLTNVCLSILALATKYLTLGHVVALAIFPGSILSLWQLQILHDNLHGSLIDKSSTAVSFLGLPITIPKKKLQHLLLFWGSMPSIFGYYLYLKFGHMSHHKNVGDEHRATLAQLFESKKIDFEDGDVLFVAHRMKLKGETGPKIKLPWSSTRPNHGNQTSITLSISRSAFQFWKEGQPFWNVFIFASSFLFERIMLAINDVVVAIAGTNFFFPNKPRQFHDECTKYCRCALIVRSVLWYFGGGYKAWLFLLLAETLWSIPPHPASAMFVTNHGSDINESDNHSCVPSSSTYAGRWYSILTLGTNYHCEHHDFPTIPLHALGQLRKIAPEFYRQGASDQLYKILTKAFSSPSYYACMDAGIGSLTLS